MPRTLKDDTGNTVEVPDEKELNELKAQAEEAKRLQDELKALEDKSTGLRHLREAIKRKDAHIQELEEKISSVPVKKEDEEEDLRMSEDDIRSMARKEAMQSLLNVEIERRLSSYALDDQKMVRTMFNKLTAGEDLNMETIQSHLIRAERAAFPERETKVSRGASYGGYAPRSQEAPKGFADTDEGKNFASQLGIRLDPPKKQ